MDLNFYSIAFNDIAQEVGRLQRKLMEYDALVEKFGDRALCNPQFVSHSTFTDDDDRAKYTMESHRKVVQNALDRRVKILAFMAPNFKDLEEASIEAMVDSIVRRNRED